MLVDQAELPKMPAGHQPFTAIPSNTETTTAAKRYSHKVGFMLLSHYARQDSGSAAPVANPHQHLTSMRQNQSLPYPPHNDVACAIHPPKEQYGNQEKRQPLPRRSSHDQGQQKAPNIRQNCNKRKTGPETIQPFSYCRNWRLGWRTGSL